MQVLRCAAMMSAVALSAGRADSLLENGSFEAPPVNSRVPVEGGGDPAKASRPRLSSSKYEPAEGGRLVTGLTNEIARTGKQSLFVDFQNLTAPGRRRIWSPTRYRQAVPVPTALRSGDGWIPSGRSALDERRPYVWVDVQFLKADRDTEAGEAQLGVQLIRETSFRGR
jgi:hypothetical protein